MKYDWIEIASCCGIGILLAGFLFAALWIAPAINFAIT